MTQTRGLVDIALKTAQLPSLPDLVNDLHGLIERDEDINVIADLLATDASLCTRLLELANTAFYGNKHVTRIFDAVHLIGLTRIELMVRTAYTIEILESVDGARLDMRKFWLKSYTAALIAQRLAQGIHYPRADSLYTSGLLMYIGDIILALLPSHLQLNKMNAFEIAAEQLSLWQFPGYIIESIRNTCSPELSPDQFALPAAIVHITYCVSGKERKPVEEDALLLTQLDDNEIDDIFNEINALDIGSARTIRH